MKLQKYLYLYLALWLAFPCMVVMIWMSDYDLLLGTRGTAFFIQAALNCGAAACGIALAFLHYQKTEKAPKNKVILAAAAAGTALLLLCLNFLCTFFDGLQEYHSFTSPDGTHAIVLMEKVGGVSGQVLLYERVSPFLISPREHIITNNGYRPVCAGRYTLAWEGDTVTLSVSDGAGGTETISIALKERGR